MDMDEETEDLLAELQLDVNEEIKKLQAEFQQNGLNLYLQGEGRAPLSREMDRFTKNPPIKFPVGSAKTLKTLQNALSNKQSVMLMKSGGNWELLIESTEKDKSGCFIATAVYGSYSAPEVMILRAFRDRVLSKNMIGNIFIRFYYVTSPFIANFISDKDKLKLILEKYAFTYLINFIQRRLSWQK